MTALPDGSKLARDAPPTIRDDSRARCACLVLLATGCDEVVAHFRIAAAKEDRLKNFDSFTPEQHYAAAIYICQHDPNRPEVLTLSIDTDCALRAGDFSRVIRHLEAIPKDSSVHEDAARALRLVKIQRDHPQDFEAAMKADYQKCFAEVAARSGPGTCGNYIDDQCSLFQPLRADYKIIVATRQHAEAQRIARTESPHKL